MWLFTGHTLWEYVTVLFDNIPKVIYLIYTAVASCLDLLQHVMRKLAGLDTYWIRGQAYVQQDPVLEFIYGMLGIGEHAGIYSALSTVFWSIAIFGLIVLVIATMIAIIKSHYNEDTNKTNPLSYVYSAIKAIFTFAIVPVAVILGIYLSQFLLQTADNITAGTTDEGTLKGIYGDNITTYLVKQDNGCYGRYDYFGFGGETTSTPISGMLFRVAAYEANRVRKGDYMLDAIQGDTKKPNIIFGNIANKPADQDATDYVAYQVDYAFMNNFEVQGWILPHDLLGAGWGSGYGIGHTLISISGVDFFAFSAISSGFSKFNVGLVWYYYYLWKFNFFVGFASIIISFGLLTSIIVGLMSRLIYSAALFLIYPGTLGLAPLDEWNAFKSWRKEFTSQILMAFGSIVGMNVIFLILPYVNEFTWFNWGAFALPNTLINSLIIITGLLLVKEFITFLSGLIGSKSAADTGENQKKGLLGAVKSGAGLMASATNVGLKTLGAIPKFGMRMAKAGQASNTVKQIDSDAAAIEAKKVNVDDARATNATAVGTLLSLGRGADAGWDKVSDAVDQEAKNKGIVLGSAEHQAMRAEAADRYLSEHDKNYQENKQRIENGGFTDQEAKELNDLQTSRQKLVAENYLDKDGNVDKASAMKLGKATMKEIGGAILKGAAENAGSFGINPGAFKEIGHRFGNMKYDKEGNAAGVWGGMDEKENENYRGRKKLRQDAYNAAKTAGMSDKDAKHAAREAMGTTFDQRLVRAIDRLGNTLVTPPKETKGDKAIGEAAQQISKAAADLKAATKDLKRYKP